MKRSLVLMSLLLWWAPARASALSLRLEAGAVVTAGMGPGTGDPHPSWMAGILVDQRLLDSPLLAVDGWVDAQIPNLIFDTGGAPIDSVFSSTYLPLALGARLAFKLGMFEPFAGLLGQVAILTDPGLSTTAGTPLWGVGGNAGLDLVVAPFRFGLDVRAVDVVDHPNTVGGTSSPLQFEALLSAGVLL